MIKNRLSYNQAMRIRLLGPDDLADAMHLKDAAGWNQTEEDWLRLLDLSPEGCFAAECDDRVVSTATVVCYGRDLAWIGMVLTKPEYRGRGLARAVMNSALEFARARGVAQAGLDATELGAGLYRTFGFWDQCDVARWQREPQAAQARLGQATGAVEVYRPAPELDRAAFGAERAALLASLARHECASVGDAAFAMGRPGSKAAYFGPCVSRDGESVRRLLEWYLPAHAHETVYWDLLADHRAAARLARESGFHPLRKLTRMRLNLRDDVPTGGDDALVYALAGFEYG